METDSRPNKFSDFDSYLFHEGTDYELYKKLGAHPDCEDGAEGTRFMVWAPNAQAVSLITARTGWENITAVKDGKLYEFDDNLVSRPGPRLVEGLEVIAHLLHPERFEEN